MKRLVGTLLASLALAGAAHAADFSQGTAPGWSASSWNGFYVGASGGYSWGQASFTTPLLVPASLNLTGGLFGIQTGYDFDLGNNFVLGLAGDASWGSISGTTCVDNGGCSPPTADDSYANGTIDWLGTLRARAGVTSGNALFYVTGGVAYAHSNASITNVGGLGDTWSASKGSWGWTVGGGGEVKLSQHVSVGAEALYVDLGTTNYNFSDGGAPTTVPVRVTDTILRAFINYRF